ncbi:MAG TPA: c-type cytochrome biogenesis protein CcsB [Proteobacteria bacterium]|nr:cytochrome c biogenesis protein CcsA [bacterium BMS3Abin14]HDL53198.1 c-type cytochrome biogenesis protein CcsB [Pseudomonadota bacterium]
MSSSTLFGIATFAYLFATFFYVGYLAFRGRVVGNVATGMVWLGVVTQAAAMIIRWVESYRMGIGHAPLSNMYESLGFFGWCVMIAYLVVEYRFKQKAVGAFVSPLAFVILAANALLFPDQIQPLVPALQSNWLIAHVVTSFVAYGSFAVSFGVSIMYLVKNRAERMGGEGSLVSLFPESKMLDEVNYKSVAVGFPLLSLGIITGAAWANYAWGTYWSWDPKETWSLITWFIYAAYLHARLTRGWQGRRAAILSIVGFSAVIFTYFGVNFLLSGLHSYA